MGRTSSRGVVPGLSAGDEDHELLLRDAYVHLERYFRVWLADLPAAEELVPALALEALVRLGRSGALAGDDTATVLAMRCAAVAHGLACEIRG